MPTVLIADDEPPIRRFLERFLAAQGYATESVESGEAALDAARERRPDLVLLDVVMPGIGGLETLERLSRELPRVPVVIMTATGSIEIAVRAFKLGAVDFVTKPFDDTKLLGAVEAAVSTRSSHVEIRGPMMIGDSPRFRDVLELAHKVARPDINVLLQGETGTGKELFARYIHESSKRSLGPFIPVDCSILSENLIESELFGHEKGAFTGATGSRIGHFERANGGTLFLDEIGNLRLDTQAKLLRVLQERTMERVGGRETIKLDIRVISATNVNLKEAVERRTFRQDLYFRLREMVLVTPPLRERGDDVRRLAQHFLERYSARYERPAKELSAEAIALLEAHGWPGNVRELENVMKGAVILADDKVLPRHLPPDIGAGRAADNAASRLVDTPPFTLPSAALSSDDDVKADGRTQISVTIEIDMTKDELDLKAIIAEAAEKMERAVLEKMVKQGVHKKTELAKVLGIDTKTLRTKLQKHGTKP